MEYNNMNEVADKIKQLVDEYVDDKYPEDDLIEMPEIDELEDMVDELNKMLVMEHPQLAECLSPPIGEDELQIAYLGCGYLLWGILFGSLFFKCNKNRCCCRKCRCGRGCRCGTGCRR